MHFSALQIELLGKGVVRWEKEHYFVDHHNGSRRFSRSSVHFPSRIPDEETYIYQKKYLVGESKETLKTLHYLHELQENMSFLFAS